MVKLKKNGKAGRICNITGNSADLHVALFDAVKDGDLARATAIADRIYPLVEVFYSDPLVDMHNRMKEANVLLGQMDRCYVRPPLQAISQEERERIRHLIMEANLPRYHEGP